jgi:hypothetical protein
MAAATGCRALPGLGVARERGHGRRPGAGGAACPASGDRAAAPSGACRLPKPPVLRTSRGRYRQRRAGNFGDRAVPAGRGRLPAGKAAGGELRDIATAVADLAPRCWWPPVLIGARPCQAGRVAPASQRDREIALGRIREVLDRLVRDGTAVARSAVVDRNHRFDAVFLDLAYLGRLLRPGGIVFVDDYHLPGIARAASFFLANLGWSLEGVSAAEDRHHWAVLRTSAKPDTRPFDYFVDF